MPGPRRARHAGGPVQRGSCGSRRSSPLFTSAGKLSRDALARGEVMARAKGDYHKCAAPGCNQQIKPGEKSVATGGGPMHANCNETMLLDVARSIADAVADGTHGPSRYMCMHPAHRDWVDSIYCTTIGDGTPLCFACAMHSGEFEKLTDAQLDRIGSGQVPNPIPAEPEFPARCFEYLNRRRATRKALAEWQRAWVPPVAMGR